MAYHVTEKRLIHAGAKLRYEIHHLADEQGNPAQKEVVVHPGAVVILPFLDLATLLLIQNHRWAVGQTLIELPAGTLNPGENPMNAAGRELLEETGHLAGRLLPMGSFYASPGVLSEMMHLFAAFDLEPGPPHLEPAEEIQTIRVSFDDAVRMIGDHRIVDGKTIAGILMYDRFFARR